MSGVTLSTDLSTKLHRTTLCRPNTTTRRLGVHLGRPAQTQLHRCGPHEQTRTDRQAGEAKEKVGKVEEKVEEVIDKAKGVLHPK